MTYDIVIPPESKFELPKMIDWLVENDLRMYKDWDVITPDYFKNDWNHTFKFKRSEDAAFFALRWV